VNKNVTTPEGAAALDTLVDCHTKQQQKLQLKAYDTMIERLDLPRNVESDPCYRFANE
jgi:hypothetical protein